MTTATYAIPASQLTPEQVAHFSELGYLVLPSFLSSGLVTALKAELDQWVAGAPADDHYAPTAVGEKTRRLPMDLREHGRLISHPPLMAILEQLLGKGFGYHHLHTARHDAGSAGVDWHHDYEQFPQANRSHAMIHTFHYLNGLDGTIGDLLILPRSQHIVCDRFHLGKQFGSQDLPGTIALNSLPPGSTVIVNSALLHARRAKPGGEGHPRYFIDCAYCQAGVRWPSYHGDWRSGLRRALELGLDRDGRYAHLFDAGHFYDSPAMWQKFAAVNIGSLAPALIGERP